MTTSQSIIVAIVILILLTLVRLAAKAYKTKLIDNPLTPYVITHGGKWFKYNYLKHLTKRVEYGAYFIPLRDKADKWSTCPCGNLPQCIKRDTEGVPLDLELRHLGEKFSLKSRELVTKNHHELALIQEELIALMRQIELRGRIVTRQELAKHNELHVLSLIANK